MCGASNRLSACAPLLFMGKAGDDGRLCPGRRTSERRAARGAQVEPEARRLCSKFAYTCVPVAVAYRALCVCRRARIFNNAQLAHTRWRRQVNLLNMRRMLMRGQPRICIYVVLQPLRPLVARRVTRRPTQLARAMHTNAVQRLRPIAQVQ